MNTTSLECYGCDPRARAIRFETSARHWLILPHEQLVYADLEMADAEDRLTLVFVTHEVVLIGHLLKRLEGAILERELAWITPRGHSQKEFAKGAVFIRELKVRSLEAHPKSTAPTIGPTEDTPEP